MDSPAADVRLTLDDDVDEAMCTFARPGACVVPLGEAVPDRPQFELVNDLEPYLAEHRRFILSWLRFWEQ